MENQNNPISNNPSTTDIPPMQTGTPQSNVPPQPVIPVEQPLPRVDQLPTETPQVPIEPKKSKGLVFLLIFFFILVLVLGSYYLYQKFLSQKSTVNPPIPAEPTIEATVPTPTTDPTADWKTYTNTKYKFSFKYPSEVFFQGKTDSDYIFLESDKNFVMPLGGWDSQPTDIEISIDQNSKNLTFSEKVNSIKKLLDNTSVSESEIALSSSIGKQISGQGASETPLQESRWIFIILKIPNINKFVDISLIESGKFNINTFNQILSTFKFTETNPSPTP